MNVFRFIVKTILWAPVTLVCWLMPLSVLERITNWLERTIVRLEQD